MPRTEQDSQLKGTDDIASNKLQEKLGKLETMRHILREAAPDIDEGIFETIVMLNALGFSTDQSCEGHLDRNHVSAKPWILLAAPHRPEWRYEGQKKYWEQIAQKQNIAYQDFMNGHTNLSAEECIQLILHQPESEYTGEFEEWMRKNEDVAAKLEGFVKEFNSNQTPLEETRLWLLKNGDYEMHFAICQSGNPVLQKITQYRESNQAIMLTEEEKKDAEDGLEACQAEIRSFTLFLREKYLHQDGL